MSENKIVITKEDLKKPNIQERVNSQRKIKKISEEYTRAAETGASIGQIDRDNSTSSSPYQSADMLYFFIAGILSGLLGWLAQEAQSLFLEPKNVFVSAMLTFSIVGMFLGIGLGAIDGILERSSQKAIKGGAIGLLIGALGGGVSGLLGQFIYGYMLSATTSPSLSMYIFARSLGWGIVGMLIGSVPGIILQASKKIRNGLLGGLLGGVLGGAVFDPIGILLQSDVISRLFGIIFIGGAIGVLMSIAEELFKEAWLLVEEGPLQGKQFILYKNPTLIGSSPDCEIYLFKDPNVHPQHVAITVSTSGNNIRPLTNDASFKVNGQLSNNSHLKNGDAIRIGKYLFRYGEKRRSLN